MLYRALKVVLILVISFVGIIIGLIGCGLSFASGRGLARLQSVCTMWWARAMCRVLGIRVHKRGSFARHGAAFIVSNHMSYLDIFVLGSVMPLVFLSRHDVRDWPLMGILARLGGTIFIDRGSKKAVHETVKRISDRLGCGISVVVFPEGTTSDGSRVKQFRSPVFEAAAAGGMPVRPMTIDYARIDGKGFPGQGRDPLAWYGDMTLMPHAWHLFSLRRIDATVMIHHPLAQDGDVPPDRKELAARSHAVVQTGLDELRGSRHREKSA